MRKPSLIAVSVAFSAVLFLAPRELPAARLTKDERAAKRVAHLNQLLESERFSLRAKAAEILGVMGVKDSGPAIMKLFADSEPGVREAAAKSLARLGHVEAVDDIIKLLGDSSLAVQRAAIDALGDLRDPKALQPLLEKGKETKEESFYTPIAIALGKLGDRKAGSTMYKIYGLIKDDANKCKVAGSLGRLNGAEAVKLLEDLSKEDDMRVKYEALWASGEMNNKDGYDWLMKRTSKLQSMVTYYDDETGIRDAFSTAIGRMRDPKLLRAALKELGQDRPAADKLPKDLLTAIRGLGRSGVTELYDDLKGLMEDGNEEVKLAAIEAVGRIHAVDAVKALIRNLERPNFQVVVASIVALGDIAPDEAIDPLIKKLEVDDWRIRFVAARALMSMRCEDMLEPMIKALGKSKEWMQKELAGMLHDCTNKDMGLDVAGWEKWWEGNKDKFEILYEEDLLSSDQTMTFYGVEINTNKVVFCLDRSGSMTLPASEWEDTVSTMGAGGNDAGDDLAPKDPKEAGKKKKKGIRTKMELLKVELIRMVKNLKPSVNFNLIQYSSDVQPWKKEKDKMLVPATDANKDECVKYIEKMSPGGGTAIYDALKRGFLYAAGAPDGKGDELKRLQDPKHELKVDTIFLMTDGTPMGGEIADPPKILEAVREWNKLGRIRVHAVGIGEGQNVDFLRKLAAQNGGKYSQN